MGKTIPLTNETFLEKIKTLNNADEYEFLDEYKNYETKLRCHHKKCGYTYSVTPHHFIAGNRCPKCAGNARRNTEQFKKEVAAKFGDRYEILTEYKNNSYPIIVKCNKCENEFKAYPVKLLAGRECPYCCDRNNSKGRREVITYLKKKNIEFLQEKIFDGCIGQSGKTLLKFDFYIPNRNLIIEFDGEFHYIKKYENQRFEAQCQNDLIKDEYCKENKINLLRIPFWYESKIKSILNKCFKMEEIYIPKMKNIGDKLDLNI